MTLLEALKALRGNPLTQNELTEALYQRWFVDWRAPADLTAQASGDDRFVAELSALAGTKTSWVPGWTVRSRSGPTAFVTDGRVQLWVEAKDELSPKNARAGSPVRLRLPCARGCAAPGFFLFVSPHGRAGSRHDKLYLHLTAAGGRAVIRRLSTLDARFEVKVANAPEAYFRRDAGVVYFEPHHRDRLVRALRPLAANPKLFKAAVPPMTHRLARGLAWVEADASTDTSFGESRCVLVARGLLRAHAAGSRSLEPYLSQSLREGGVDPKSAWKRTISRRPEAQTDHRPAPAARGTRRRRPTAAPASSRRTAR